MSRSTHYFGFPKGHWELLHTEHMCKACGHVFTKSRFVEEDTGQLVTGIVNESVYKCKQYSNDKGEVVYKEVEQCTPWSSGPCIFMRLVDGNGRSVLKWSEEEIDQYL